MFTPVPRASTVTILSLSPEGLRFKRNGNKKTFSPYRVSSFKCNMSSNMPLFTEEGWGAGWGEGVRLVITVKEYLERSYKIRGYCDRVG